MGGCHITPSHPMYAHYKGLKKFRMGDVIVISSSKHCGDLGIVLGEYFLDSYKIPHAYRVMIGYKESDEGEVLLDDPDVFVFTDKYLEVIDHDPDLLKEPSKTSLKSPIKSLTYFRSQTSDKRYEVVEREDLTLSCNCLAFIEFHDCKHIREVKQSHDSLHKESASNHFQIWGQSWTNFLEEDGKTYTFEKLKRSIRERVDMLAYAQPGKTFAETEPYDWYLVVTCGCCKDKKRIALKDIPFKTFEDIKE